jgi:hypothetical protein
MTLRRNVDEYDFGVNQAVKRVIMDALKSAALPDGHFTTADKLLFKEKARFPDNLPQ